MSEVGRGYARPRPSKAVRGRGRGLNVNHDCGPMTKMLRPSFRPSYRRRWQNGSWLAAQHTITPTGAAACRRMTSLARASGLRFCAVCRRPSPLSLSLSLVSLRPALRQKVPNGDILILKERRAWEGECHCRLPLTKAEP